MNILVPLFFVAVFIICWIICVIIWGMNYWRGLKLYRILKQRHSHIRRNFGLLDGIFPLKKLHLKAKADFKSIVSFGSPIQIKERFNHHLDVKAVEESEDMELKLLLISMIKASSWWIRIFIIGIFSLLLAALTWA